ncbi:MAG TPA: hypothetical protein VFQ44_06550 [Streptosporangiaceae bacterium]|nr:hypothetical protein [Streptosporangiaceae bacterium]
MLSGACPKKPTMLVSRPSSSIVPKSTPSISGVPSPAFMAHPNLISVPRVSITLVRSKEIPG